VTFDSTKATVTDSDNRAVLTAYRRGGLYYLRRKTGDRDPTVNLANNADPMENVMRWHRRMGHLNIRDLIKCHEDKSVCGTDLKKVNREFVCEICVRGKMTKTPFPKNEPRNSEILEIIHSDVCGPMRTESNGGARYLVTFIDDYSRWCEIHLLRRKDEVLAAFKDFKMKVENYHSRKIKFLQTDNGKEYCNTEFDNFLRENGIQRRLTVTHTPEQNGVAERRNRTLLDTTRCLLIDSGLSQSFWGEAISTANYLRNRCPSSSLKGKTPFEKWNNRVPDVSHLRPFGTEVFTVDRDSTKGKLDPRSKKDILQKGIESGSLTKGRSTSLEM